MTREIISNAKSAVKGHWWQIVGTTILFALVTGITSAIISAIVGIFGLSTELVDGQTMSAGYVIYELLGAIVGCFLSTGLMKYIIDKYHGDGHCKDIFYGFVDYKKSLYIMIDELILAAYIFVVTFVCVLVATLIPYLGVLIAIFGAIYAAYWLMRGSFFAYAIMEGYKPINAYKRSFTITKGHVWQAIWMGIRLTLIPTLILIFATVIILVMTAVSGITAAALASDALTGAAIGFIIGFIFILAACIWYLILSPAAMFLNVAYYEEHSGERLNIGLVKLDGDKETVEVEFKEIEDENK